jgi:hypothetical protein
VRPEPVAIGADHVALKRLLIHCFETLSFGDVKRLCTWVSMVKLKQVGWEGLLTVKAETSMGFYNFDLQASPVSVYLFHTLCFICVWHIHP